MVTGAVGVAAYEALRKMVVKAPLRAATVSVATGFNVDAVRAVAIEETVSATATPMTAGTNTAETRSNSVGGDLFDRCAGNAVTRRLLDRDGFAGEHRLVDGGATGC